MGRFAVVVVLLILAAVPALAAERGPMVDLTKAVLVTAGSPGSTPEGMAVSVLRQEVNKRTGVSWSEAAEPAQTIPVIVVATRTSLPRFAADLINERKVLDLSRANGAEGYTVAVVSKGREAPTVFALGNDTRGTLFAVGRLLRELRMRPGSITLPEGFSETRAPKYAQRSHQLGYRPKSNSYDAWDVKRFDQYIRDLAVFGTNQIELIPSFAMDDGQYTSPLMPLDPWEMTLALPKVIDSYGMGVWFWIPYNNDNSKRMDISKPEEVKASLALREKFFKSINSLEAIIVPTGDPGDQPPEVVMPYLKKLSALLKSIHPNAQLWSTSQGFSEDSLAWFYRYLQDNQPTWYDGLDYGPWTHDTLEHTRAMVPKRYPIRMYPDITHTVRCQMPVPDWDDAFAWTLNREPINPRPTQEAHICRLMAPYSVGFGSYSDGCNDDVNKMIWSAVHYDPNADVREVLVQYGRYFIGPDYADDVADGLLALEANWTKPLLGNPQIAKTLAIWQGMEKRATPEVLANWRFQQGLYRAYYDAYVQKRLEAETALETDALVKLRNAKAMGADAAMNAARAILDSADTVQPSPELRTRVEVLAGDLYKSIGMQLSVEKYGASGAERGANLSTLDAPLNNRYWIESVFDEAKDKDETGKLAAINRLLTWEDAGPGGFYDDFGNSARQPHLVKTPGFEKDPSFVLSAQCGFGGPEKTKLAWRHYAEALYTTPLRAHYEGLDPKARYEMEVVYAGRYNATMVCEAEGIEVHGPVAPSRPPTRMGFAIPAAATADGMLDLTWHQTTGRGPQIAELWLIKK